VVREHYLRDDIYCGALFCKVCDTTGARFTSSESTILVLDTNVVLNQVAVIVVLRGEKILIDLLENSAIDDVVVLSVVLEEVKNKNLAVYNRLRALCSNTLRRFFVFSNEHHKDTYVKAMAGESPNDRNDRAIRVAAQWYQNHLGGATKILMVTNDRENKRKAIEEGISADTVESYVKSLGQPALLDLLVQPNSSEDMEIEDLRPSKKKAIYTESYKNAIDGCIHKPMSEITSGIRCGIYHQGKLRVNRYNPFEAYVGSESIGDEIIISGRGNMNRAFDGDVVAVELLPQDQWQNEASLHIAEEDDEEDDGVHLAPSSADVAPRIANPAQGSAENVNNSPSRPSGRVVGIIKRNWHAYCGSLEPMPMPAGNAGIAHALFVSKDRRFPKIRIQTRQLGNLLDKRIIVAVDTWDCQSRYPSGHYVRTIGDIGDRETETEVVLIENDIDARPFSSQVLACLPPLPWSVSSEDLSNPIRQDLRHLRIFSVDPPGCKDIDDALHCTSLPNGNFEVGVRILETYNDDLVNIADVTNFVHPGTPLDSEATQRGTSTYLVERRIDMLPKPLTEDICSLRADVERLAFSVIWEMTPEAHVISTRYTKSVIKSCAALSYVEAQARMDDSRLMDPVTADLRNMNALAKIMRQRRIERGAITLASAEVKFQVDTETHDPLDIGMYQIREANQMVEEFMLAANVSVAEQILKKFPQCSLLRRHPSPTKEMLEPLLRTAAAVGLDLDVSSSKALADSLDRAVLPNHITRAYDLNYRHRNAQMASRSSIELHTIIFFRKRPTDTEARIVKIRANGFIVFVPKYGIEGPVHLTMRGAKGGGEWVVDEQQQVIKKVDGSVSYGVLQTVKIHMEVVEPQPNRPKLQLTLI
ncbi:hypothetical protein M8C21_008447, partial [Ambrosia artemisiifolia]